MTNSIFNRRTVRDFSDKKIPVEILTDIIKEAQLAPSWANSQFWKAYIATGENLDSIKAVHLERSLKGQGGWTDVLPPQEWTIHAKDNIAAWEQGTAEFFSPQDLQVALSAQAKLFNTQAVVYLTMPKGSSHFSAYDLGAFGYGILLAAQDRGLASIPAYGFIRYPDTVRDAFQIPEDESIFMGIGLGYASDSVVNTLKSPRRAVTDILTILE